MYTNIGKKVELLQAERNVTNNELAKRMGIKAQNIPGIKRAKHVRVTTVHKLAKALDVPVIYFFEE